ncbi:mucin-3B [Neoarius graeffei]|uniref:mucin-3B n=1 Tax=Neoarius graeffei TaxID=443677 RepID=UPI00298C9B74|nr:mucin-3B [Neoarius graeffei]
MRLLHFCLLLTLITGFNTSEEDPNPSQFPYPDSHSDLASPSRDGSTGVTRLPDTFSFRSARTLQTASVRQGGEYTGSGDKTRLHVVPQESTHNGQEKAGTVISDLARTAPHSLTDSKLLFSEKEHDSSLFSAETQQPGLFLRTTVTSEYSNTGTSALPERIPRTIKIYSDIHDDTDTPSVHSDALDPPDSNIFHSSDITVMSSAPPVSRLHLSTIRNGATVTDLRTSESHDVTVGHDMSVMSSHTASEGTNAAYRSSETDRFTHHMDQNNPDLSVTDESNLVSDPEVSEFNGVTYTSDGTARSSAYTDTSEIQAGQTYRLPRSTRVNKNISNHTRSSVFDDSSTVTDTPRAPVSHSHVDTATLSDSHSNATENVTAINRKRTEYYSYTPYYSNSPNTDSATTQASHTIHSEHTTNQRTSDLNTQRPSSEILPTLSESRSGSVTSPRRDLTSISASYSANTLGQDEPVHSSARPTSVLLSVLTTLRNNPTTALEGLITAEANSSTGSEVQTNTDHDDEITEMNTVTNNLSESRPATTPTAPNPAAPPRLRLTSPPVNTVTTSTPPANLQTSYFITTTPIPNRLTTSRAVQILQLPDTTTRRAHASTRSQPGPHTPAITQTSPLHTFTTETSKGWSHKGRVFITEDQPAVISVETFQVLLQVILEEISPPYAGLVEVEPFLQNVAGYQSQRVTWHSGPVLQSLVTFRTVEAVSWLRRAESLLQEAGLRPLPTRGIFVSGVRVKNITVGGLHSDVCSWLFSCPPDFYCVSSERNISCRSVCHSEYCKNHGICVHRSGQHPLCQCPVGEDYWFMGQRCDLRMTRQRLAGMCFGVLAAIAALMGLLAYLAVQRFKKMLVQAKAEQTQSSYRRFNHFDELSARFWRRSWPGSVDSLDHTAFSRSDELLHMRALDRACCYHDDTLSIASTYPDSVKHLNTVYPHSSQYHWDMSTCSLADGVIDSGKASDLSVCSWPIEPIQWTPFPLLQQLRNTNTVKPSRPRSYCEGMELVGLEKSRTA